MPANTPRIEFLAGAERRKKLELLRKRLSETAGRRVSMSELVNSILDQFFRLNEEAKK